MTAERIVVWVGNSAATTWPSNIGQSKRAQELPAGKGGR